MAQDYPRPKFRREESWRYKRVKEAWRAPHGKTSRVRRSKKGWPAVVKIGYSHPRATRGMHPSVLRETLVWRAKDLEGIDPKTHVARIAHTVGESKRVQIIDEAKKKNIRILNPGLKRQPAAVPEVPAEPAEAELTETKEEPTTEPIPTVKEKPKKKRTTTKKRKSKGRKSSK
jgi:large subunit ribosomal protein L32e